MCANQRESDHHTVEPKADIETFYECGKNYDFMRSL